MDAPFTIQTSGHPSNLTYSNGMWANIATSGVDQYSTSIPFCSFSICMASKHLINLRIPPENKLFRYSGCEWASEWSCHWHANIVYVPSCLDPLLACIVITDDMSGVLAPTSCCTLPVIYETWLQFAVTKWNWIRRDRSRRRRHKGNACCDWRPHDRSTLDAHSRRATQLLNLFAHPLAPCDDDEELPL